MSEEIVQEEVELGFPWQTSDPFLFCVHHVDAYPKGNASMGPAASLAGRHIGQDFAGKDGWSMYHGKEVPGFPGHPHRGFETITIVREGLIDHSDSLGAQARFGHGDVQWMTAGKGVVHSEMFPLVNEDRDNPLELFQIWLNLPAASKFVPAHFSMFWAEQIPVKTFEGGAEVTLIAGELDGERAPSPPPDSWASQPGAEVAIWTIRLPKGSSWTLPAHEKGLKRSLFFFKGDALKVAGKKHTHHKGFHLRSDAEAVLEHSGEDMVELLLLQGRPIAEPVAQHGPFVMNTQTELRQAFMDYQRTQFGGWPYDTMAPVHPRETPRFALHADGRREEP